VSTARRACVTGRKRRTTHPTRRLANGYRRFLYLRQTDYFGAGKIRDYLQRFHSIRIAAASVQRILTKHGVGRLPNQKYQGTAIPFVDEVLRRLPFRAQVVQTTGTSKSSTSRNMYIRPRTPRLNGKVERSHRFDAQEFYQLLGKDGISDDIHLFNKQLREWENNYNHHREALR
jgi:hypothetical protein